MSASINGVLTAAGEDFVDKPVSFTFSVTQDTHCFNVSIINDDLYEETEYFFVNLTTAESSIALAPSSVTVQIIDQDSE